MSSRKDTVVVLDDFRLDGKVALVTGAGVGLGRGMALALSQAGANVACHGHPDALDTCRIIEGNDRKALGLSGDLRNEKTPASLVDATIHAFGRIDILVNNAGMIRRASAVDFTDEDWMDVLNLNLNGVWRLCREAGRHMLERGSGKIINIASLLSFQGGVFVPAYTASKSAVAGLTKALANEWAPKGVNVNAIAPGYMATDNTAALRADETRSRQILERIPAGRWGTPEDLGPVAVFLASEASRYIHGHVLVVDGGWMGR
ncbi:MAG TPA: 2-dehydro-3-deoxy-D-gluconate 5-dehydrogenase KduD [Armatimonadota bacterium]|jgi:2-deoxy-D-gluconate 3-dehydrogenase